jgi:hypothetical protein
MLPFSGSSEGHFSENSLELLPRVHRILLGPSLLPAEQGNAESHAPPHMHGEDE